MANDGQIVFEVTADGKHAIADIKEITRAIQQESKKWDDSAKKSTDAINNAFSSMVKKLVAGFSVAKIGQALLDLGKDALQAASDLEEVQNVVDVTFGKDANKIEKWAKSAGAQFGLTETQAKRFSSTMGAMLKSSGLAGDQISQVSTDLAGLAADMASFYNLDFDTAFQKIRSGISGETEPLKQLGINMSVANLEAYALQKGLNKTFSEMSQGEQAMLRYQYLMQATADAQGDFARTSDGYANAMRKLETNVEELKTKLGESFLNVVSDAVTALNGFLDMLKPDESKKTVLDDFAEIDLNTETKLEEIRKTAGEARLLAEELDKIGGSKADKAGSKIQQMAKDLSGIKLDEGKAGAVKDFISVLSENIGFLASVQGTDAQGASEWLTNIAEAANKLDENDAKGWKDLIDSIKEGLPGLENTDFGAAFFAALGDGFSDVSSKTSLLEWAVDTLGGKTNKTAQEQQYWLEICKNLVKTIPGLSSVINTETGEIKGGTDAVKEYIKAWEEGQTKLALLGALEQKESALSSRFSDLPGLQLDAALAERRLRQQRDKIQSLADKMGITVDFSRLMKVGGNQPNMWSAEQKEFNEAVDSYYQLNKASIDATDAYNKQKEALEEAKQALIEYRETIDELPGSIDNADNSVVEWSDDAKESAKTVVQAAKDALTALEDHAQGVHDTVEKAVDGIIKGFKKIERPTDSLDEQMKKLGEEEQETLTKYSGDIRKEYFDKDGVLNLKKMADNWGSLTKKEQEAYNALAKIKNKQTELNEAMQEYKPEGMKKGLQDQIDFMKEYVSNLETARKMGLSNELIASLSDGSAESAQFLANLVGDGSEEAKAAAQEVDKLFQEREKIKQEFTGSLTEQQLAADAVYQQLAEDAKAAVDALSTLPGAAGDNAKEIVASIAEGVRANVPEVEDAVNAVLSALDKLAGLSITFSVNQSPTTPVAKPKGKMTGIQPFAIGLDHVPFDGFLASLHEGEGILTAEENRIWQRFKNGGGIDYDVMGGVMRDNIKPGGNVYLDGRVVGNVISEQQGRSYRQLQRSGWQG